MESDSIKILREVVEPCRIKLSIEVKVEEVRKAFASCLTEFKKVGRVDGFRPGKTPQALLVRRYGSRIKEEAQRTLIREATTQAIKSEDVVPETSPRLENEDKLVLQEDAAFAFAVSFDVAPAFPLPTYKGITISQASAAVDDQAVNQTIDLMLRRRTSFQSVERPAEAGDMLKACWRGVIQDAPAELPENLRFILDNPNGWLALRKPEIIPGVSDLLAGVKVGDEKTLTVTFPEGYFEKELIGKTATFTVKVLEVHGAIVPVLTDELAKEMGHKDSADMKTAVRGYLAHEEERRQQDGLRQQVLNAVMQVPDFPLPPAILSRQTVDEFVNQYNAELRAGKKEQEVQPQQEKMMEQAKQSAQMNLRRRYVLTAIAKEEKITVDSEELSKAVMHIAEYQHIAPKVLYSRLEQNGRLSDLHDQLLESKTLDKVLSYCTVVPQPATPAQPA